MISVFSGNIKLGYSGEYEINEINKIIPAENKKNPNISVNLLEIKRREELTIFYILPNLFYTPNKSIYNSMSYFQTLHSKNAIALNLV